MSKGIGRLRGMVADDLPAVLAIEAESHPAPWNEKIFVEELGREWARLMVVESEAAPVVAFCNYWLVADELHLLNICCAAQHRRRGYARLLMEHMIETARQTQCRLITLEVRAGNAGAIAMYERYQFEGVGVRPAYYADNQEDALVMLLHLSSGE